MSVGDSYSRRMAPTAPKLPRTFQPADRLEEETDYRGMEFRDVDLTEMDAGLIELDESRLVNVRLSGTRMTRLVLSDSVVESSDLAGFVGDSSAMVRVRFDGSRCTGMRWVDGTVRHTTFHGCRMDMSMFWGTKFEHVRFENCNLTQADFADAQLGGAEFVDCDLSGVRLANANLVGARLVRCTLRGISDVTRLRGATVDADDLLDLTYALAEGLGITVVEK